MFEFEGIRIDVMRRRVKYSRIEFKPWGLIVIVPSHIDPHDVLEKNKDSVLKKFRKLERDFENSKKMELSQRSETDFKRMVQTYIKIHSQQLRVRIITLKFRNMKRRWGSCRSNGVIILNRFLQFLPDRLISYVIFHELIHLIIPKHNRNFKRMVSSRFENHRELEKELNLYGLKLLSDSKPAEKAKCSRPIKAV